MARKCHTTAASGKPFPKGLPTVTMSGTTPCRVRTQKDAIMWCLATNRLAKKKGRLTGSSSRIRQCMQLVSQLGGRDMRTWGWNAHIAPPCLPKPVWTSSAMQMPPWDLCIHVLCIDQGLGSGALHFACCSARGTHWSWQGHFCHDCRER